MTNITNFSTLPKSQFSVENNSQSNFFFNNQSNSLSTNFIFFPFPQGISLNTTLLNQKHQIENNNQTFQFNSKNNHENQNKKVLNEILGQSSQPINQSEKNIFSDLLSSKDLAQSINKKLKNRYEKTIIDGVEAISEVPTVSIIEANQIIGSHDSVQNDTNLTVNLVSQRQSETDLAMISPSLPDSIIPPVTLFTFVLVSGVFVLYKRSQDFQLNYAGKQPWYNQSLWKKGGLLYTLKKKLGLVKLEVADTSIFFHNRALSEASIFAKSAQVIDNKSFSQEEFLLLMKLKLLLDKDLAEYQGLQQAIDRFKIIIKAERIYANLNQIESSHQGIKQQEFYQFVQNELMQNHNSETFQMQIYNKLTEVLSQIKTEEGRSAVQSYAKNLEELAKNNFGLQVLCFLKTNSLANYHAVKTISDLIFKLNETEIIDLRYLRVQALAQFDVFESLQEFLGLSKKQSNADTYARMLQYIALEYRYQASLDKFEEFIRIIKQWYEYYKTIISIRQEYPSQQYQQPKEFTQEIPGLNLYLKYKKSLTDQKTGYSYID